MSLDREKVRALMEAAVAEGDPEFEHADAIYAWQVLALLAELEQAERERDKWELRAEKGWDAADKAGNELLRANLRLAKVPALVEALKRIESGAMSNPAHEVRNLARMALAVWESE